MQAFMLLIIAFCLAGGLNDIKKAVDNSANVCAVKLK